MNVYVVGDSISLHYGPHLEAHLRGIAGYARKTGQEAALAERNLPQQANGGDSGMVLAFLRALADTGGIRADVLLFNCGLHDIKTDPRTGARQVPLDRYAENLAAIVRTIRDLGPRPVWIRTTPFDEANHNRRVADFHRYEADLAAYNEAADGVMHELGVPVIDLHGFTRNLGDDRIADHVHFREDARALQAAFIAGWLAAFARAERVP